MQRKMTCPKKRHQYGEDFDMWCDGVPHIEFEGHTVCEYQEMCKISYLSYKKIPYYAPSIASMKYTPKIKLKGWWKRFFPRYQATQKVLQTMIDKEGPNLQNKFYELMIERMKNGSNVSFIQAEDYATKAQVDDVALYSQKHPWSFKWWFKGLLRFFRRPRFSSSAIEPAEKLITDRYKMIVDHEQAVSKSKFWGLYNPEYDPNAPHIEEDKRGIVMSSGDPDAFKIIPSPRIDYCGACKAEHGYDCPLDEVKHG